MKKGLLFLFQLICLVSISGAQSLQPLPANLQSLQPLNVFPANADEVYVFMDRNKDTKPSKFLATKMNGTPLYTAEVLEATPSHFNIQTPWKNAAPKPKCDVRLASGKERWW